MGSDRQFGSKRDDRKKDRKKKSRSKSSGSRSRSSSGSPYARKKKTKKSSHERSEKYSSKHRESRDEMPPESDYGKNMMDYQGYPMMFNKMKMPAFEMHNPMMMPGMPRGYPPAFSMPGYPMVRPPPYMPGMIPPLPNQMDPMAMHQKGPRMGPGAKPFPDQKTVPLAKKDKEKSVKKEEESEKVLEFAPPTILAETLRSLHVSVQHLQEPLFLYTCKKALTDLENRLREKKLKSRAKEISELHSTLYDKIKELEKKDKKKSTGTTNNIETPKISELELIKALNETEDITTFLSCVNLEKFNLDNCYESDMIRIKESDESVALLEEAKSLFASAKDSMSHSH